MGEVAVDGAPVTLRTPAAARHHGIAFQSGDRAAESVFRELSVMENATLGARKELGPVGSIIARRQRELYDPVAADLGIVAVSRFQPAGQLSGGNQQKAVVARSLIDPSAVLVADEPTQGVDARARLDIYQGAARAGETVASRWSSTPPTPVSWPGCATVSTCSPADASCRELPR